MQDHQANGQSFDERNPDITFIKKVDFHAELPSQKEKDEYKIVLGDGVYSGHHNGLTVYLDVETYDHAYNPTTGMGVFMVVNHHGDKPILNSGRIKLEVNHTMNKGKKGDKEEGSCRLSAMYTLCGLGWYASDR